MTDLPDIPEELKLLGVAALPATSSFRAWLASNFSGWKFEERFCQAIPQVWSHVTHGDYELCYLASEQVIMESHRRNPIAGLLPVGCLMSGSMLWLDTEADDEMRLVKINFPRLAIAEQSPLHRDDSHPLPLSYPEWLSHVRKHPTDLRYL